jgi:outer membrane protein
MINSRPQRIQNPLPRTGIAHRVAHQTGRLLAWVATPLVAMGLSGPAQAQSLQELYDAARSYDAAFISAKALAESAQYRVQLAEAALNPTLGMTAAGSAGRVDTPPRLFGGTYSQYLASVGLRGRYPLINRASAVQVEQALKSYEATRFDLETAEQDLILRVAQAYFDVLAAQDALATTRAGKAAITEQLASAKRNFEVGTATITDTREAQARFDLATAQELAAENDLRTKRIGLDQLVGRNGVLPKPLAIPLAVPVLIPNNVEEWVTMADGQHPLVRRAQIAAEVAKLEIERQRAAEKPTLDAVAAVGASETRGGVYAQAAKGRAANGSVGVEFVWPLMTGGASDARIKEALALEDKANSDVLVARRQIAQSTRVAYFGVNSVAAQVRALEAAESSSKLALEATQLGYRVGVRVNLDVLNSQTQLFTTQRDLAKARYDLIMGRLRLRQAAGQLAPTDVAAVNGLLAR